MGTGLHLLEGSPSSPVLPLGLLIDTAVPGVLPLRDEDSQVQRGPRWAGLESQRALHLGMELCLWSVLPRMIQQICRPLGPLSQALTASVSPLCSHSPSCPFQQAPTLFSFPLARFTGNPGEPCPGCLDHCLDHDLPLANCSFAFDYQIYLDSIPGFLFWLCQLKQVNLLLCAPLPSAVK